MLQRGSERPAPDSIVVPSTPLVLTRGEPTRIVVHNSLPIPLSVHWHGMELDSSYDGVGHGSGVQGHTRSPIVPGDSDECIHDTAAQRIVHVSHSWWTARRITARALWRAARDKEG
ncbi:multicopper oxidase domain-containing protein [Gemmatimonas sp.]|uniref:multicopper oxidase domain-containing protein n=1 Tax=Gemmatimonas sp. TaxID=1962908 RepID=UPI0039830B87